MAGKSVGVALGILALALGLRADQSNSGLESQAAPYLTLPSDARSAAMAQTGAAFGRDLNALSLNPAGLANVSGQQLALNQNFWVQGSSLETLSYGLGLFRHAALAASLNYMSSGSIDRTSFDSGGNLVTNGSFNPYSYNAGLAYAQELFSDFNAGAQLKLVSQNIDTSSATAFAVDLGVQYLSPVRGLNLGLSVQNLGSKLASSNLPALTRAGLSYAFGLGSHPALLISADAQIPNASPKESSYGVGAEFRLGRSLALRGGYLASDNSGMSGLTGLTAGAGFSHDWWQLDYAWLPMGDLGYANQFSLLTKF